MKNLIKMLNDNIIVDQNEMSDISIILYNKPIINNSNIKFFLHIFDYINYVI